MRQRVHPLVGPASMHAALIQGGVGISTCAPECTLRVDYGSTGEGAHEAVEWVDTASVERTTAVLVEAARRFFR